MRNRNRNTRRPFRSGHVRRQNNYRQESTRRPLSSLLLFASWARGLECLYTDFRDFTLLRIPLAAHIHRMYSTGSSHFHECIPLSVHISTNVFHCHHHHRSARIIFPHFHHHHHLCRRIVLHVADSSRMYSTGSSHSPNVFHCQLTFTLSPP